jgi:hypothetical protein
VVDQISADYAHQPVVFLENYYLSPPGDRRSRFFAAVPSQDSYYFPWISVDSGHLWSLGPTDYSTDYRAMVDAELSRPPQGSISVERVRVGDTFEFTIEVTNATGVELSYSNQATVHAIVFEDAPDGLSRVTDRYVRGAAYGFIAWLADGATDSFDLVVDLTGIAVDWNDLHSVVLVDYRPGGSSGPYDMIQAAFQP